MLEIYRTTHPGTFGTLKKYNNLEDFYNSITVFVREEEKLEKDFAAAFSYAPSKLIKSEELLLKPKRKKDSVEAVTMYVIDVDHVYSASVEKKLRKRLAELGWGGIFYPTPSYMMPDSTHNGDLKRNFRVFIALSENVPVDIWESFYEVIEEEIGLGVEFDASFKRAHQYAIGPYQVGYHTKHDIKVTKSFLPGAPIDAQKYLKIATDRSEDLAIARETERTAAEERRRALKELEGDISYDGVLKEDRPIINQIAFEDLGVDDWVRFVKLCGLTVDSVEDSLISFTCDGDHEHHATEASIKLTESGMIAFHCFHETCQFGSGEGSSTKWLEGHRDKIPKEWIRGSRIIEIVPDMKITTPEELAAGLAKESVPGAVIPKKDLVNVHENPDITGTDAPIHALRSGSRFVGGIFNTGFGKTYDIGVYCAECVQKGEQVIIFVPTIKAMVDFESDFKDLLAKSGYSMEEIYALHITLCDASRGEAPSEKASIVITHYHYLKRRGDTDHLYKIVSWCEEQKPVVIFDEVDSVFTVLRGSIGLTGRFFRYPDGGFGSKSKCPAYSGNSKYCCANCELRDMVSYDSVFSHLGQPTSYSPLFTDHSLVSIANLPCLNDFTKTEVVHKTLVSELKCSYLRTPKNKLQMLSTPDSDPDHTFLTPVFSKAAPSIWVKHIIDYSLFSYVVSATDDSRKAKYENAYAAGIKKFFNKKAKECAKEERASLKKVVQNYMGLELAHKESFTVEEENMGKEARKYATSAVNVLISKGKLPPYPYHPCGTSTLEYFDSWGLSRVLSACKRGRFFTATLTENQKKVLDSLAPATEWFGGEDPKFKAIDDLLIVTTALDASLLRVEKRSLSSREIIVEKALKRATVAPVNGNRRIINKTLMFVKAKNELEKIANINNALKSQGGARIGAYLDNGLATDSSGSDWGLMVSYPRSQIGRGVNLGDFSSVHVDYGSLKPMLTYDFTSCKDLDEARKKEHVALLKQAAGRIMRKATALVGGKLVDLEEHKKRMICVSGCFQELTKKDEEGKHIVVDFSKTIAENLRNSFKKMVRGSVQELVLTKYDYWDEDDFWRIKTEIQEKWDAGEPLVFKPSIPDAVYKKKDFEAACKQNPKLKKMLSEKEFLNAKYTMVLKELRVKCRGLTKAERRVKVNWARLAKKVPESVMSEYKKFFEGELAEINETTVGGN